MGTSLVKMPFGNETRLDLVYKSKELEHYVNEPIADPQIRKMYGELKFGDLPKDRPYTFASFVTSIDGRIAFSDAPQGPLISRMNKLDETGAVSDWWILNMLRSAADGIIIGNGTIIAEKDYTGHVFDEQLEEARIRAGLYPVPWNIIISSDGVRIPYDHILFQKEEIPVMICTSKKRLSYVTSHLKRKCVMVDADRMEKEKINEEWLGSLERGTVVILAEGDVQPDAALSLNMLKKMGMDRLLIETPSYMHHLLSLKLMDELFLNYSCLYIGGKALTLGQSGKEFTSLDHPHTKILSIHSHSDSFFYFRHKFVY